LSLQRKTSICLSMILCIAIIGPAAGQNSSIAQLQNAATRAARIGSKLDRLLNETSASQWIAIGVALRRNDLPTPVAPRQAAIESRQRRVMNSLAPGSFQLKRQYRSLSGLALSVQKPAIEGLSRNPEVEFLYLDAKVHAVLAQGVGLVGGDTAHSLGFTGTGVKVAVLDTGIDTNHPDLLDDLMAQHCFCDTHPSPQFGGCCAGNSGESTSAEDDEGHGTAVSGIITSSGAVAPVGVAPDAEVVAVKVLGSSGSGDFSDIAAGLDWILTERLVVGSPVEGVRVVNMSLSDSGEYANASASPCAGTNTANAIAALHAVGVAVFASSGNDGHDNGIAFPACVAQAISVGGVYDASLGSVSWCGNADCTTILCNDNPTAADTFVCHTNSGVLLDVLAPNWRTDTSALGGGTAAFAGTSASSPYAAGQAALLLDVDDTLTPENLRTLLTNHGPQIINPDNGLSFSRSDVGAAIAAIAPSTCGNAIIEGSEDCDDGNTAGGDCCSATCAFESVGDACNDGDACTASDSCDGAGSCVAGSPPVCDDGLFCNGDEFCDSALGCQNGTAPSADDGIACTDDSCDEANDLIIRFENDLLCDDQNPCTADSCDELIGCRNEPIDACTVESVPTVRSNGRLLLVLLMLAAAGVLIRSRKSRRA
jgi:cysteine-rich repeat protein